MKKLMIMLSVLIVILGVTIPSIAQDDWPEGCQLPDLEEAMNAANEAQAEGDVVAFVNSMSEMNRVIDGALLEDCLESAVENDVDLAEVDLLEANLQFANLNGASLHGARIWGAELYRADLRYADLQGANLSGANLQGADLTMSNLQMASTRLLSPLGGINLQGAILSGANLQGMDFFGPEFDETTILPDGTNWTPDTDMARFTNPDLPDFWDPCVELEEQPWYCEDDGSE